MHNRGAQPLIARYMASTFAITRNHLIFGICLPLALLLGYLLADAQDPMSLFFVGITGTVLSIPLLLKWYHPLLIICWNMNAAPALPGRPSLWAVMAVVTLLFAVLNRTLSLEHRVAPVRELTRPLIVLFVVIVITALAAGGIGIGMLRSSTVGGRNYFYLFTAILGFFALSSRVIPPGRAKFYLSLFFLPGVISLITMVPQWLGPLAPVVGLLFPLGSDGDLAPNTDLTDSDQFRLNGIVHATAMVFFWLLSRVGVRGLFDITKPWRAILMVVLFTASTLGGFRSVAIFMGLVFGALFVIEGLWRTRLMLVMGVVVVIFGVLLFGFAEKMPFAVQRTFSFLPIDIDPVARTSAETSSLWRFEMWQEAIKSVPTYLFRGKGYSASSQDLYMVNFAMFMGHAPSWEWALISGDYHNGPLSVIIPFGIYGVLAFGWLLTVGTIFLYRNYKNSSPELLLINRFLFGLFVVRIFFFIFIFGAFAQDLFAFTGILGLSVALNVPGPQVNESPAFSGTFGQSQASGQ